MGSEWLVYVVFFWFSFWYSWCMLVVFGCLVVLRLFSCCR